MNGSIGPFLIAHAEVTGRFWGKGNVTRVNAFSLIGSRKGGRRDTSPRDYGHRTRDWVGACYGYGEFVTAHEATDSEHYIP